MVKVPVYNKEGKKEKELELAAHIFGVPVKDAVVHQVYTAQMANARGVYADTKKRGEVSGGGKKPWRQKGTGRARHGSIRSPLWRGGGNIFGPTSERNFKQKVNKKMRQLAVRMCLSDKVASDRFIVVNALHELEPKTKVFAKLLSLFSVRGKTTLFLTASTSTPVVRSLRNISKLDISRARDVNVVELMHHQYVVTTPEAVEVLGALFKKTA